MPLRDVELAFLAPVVCPPRYLRHSASRRFLDAPYDEKQMSSSFCPYPAFRYSYLPTSVVPLSHCPGVSFPITCSSCRSRRSFLASVIAIPLPALIQYAFPSRAYADGKTSELLPLVLYTDLSGFSLLRPTEWLRDGIVTTRRFALASGEGPSVAFSHPLDPSENVSVLSRPMITGSDSLNAVPRPSLGALGPPAGFGRKLVRSLSTPDRMRVASLERAYARDRAGNLLVNGEIGEAEARGEDVYYVVEYSVASPKWVRRNLCVAALSRDGGLVTLNMQAPAQRWSSIRSTFEAIAASFTIL